MRACGESPLAGPEPLADALVEELRLRGRPAHAVPANGFLRSASLRLEQGRTNPDAFYTDWLDESGLRREVLDPAGPGGSGRILPSLWDPATDRASRAGYSPLEPAAVVLVTGGFLLGGALAFDLTVHLVVSPGALARRTPPDWAWTLAGLAAVRVRGRPGRLGRRRGAHRRPASSGGRRAGVSENEPDERFDSRG